ncbi:MAG: mannitol dehydrogenase family protein [Betaproteobacteria bacterium]
MSVLTPKLVDALPAGIARPGYDPSQTRIGIVHLGIGAFHRAHQAIYTDDALASAGPDRDWGICGVSLRSADVRNRLTPQAALYTAVEKSSAGIQRRIIGSVREVLFLGDERDTVDARLASPSTRIVSLTVTEKGYCHDPATGRLNFSHPDIVHDLADPAHANSVVGLIVATCAARRAGNAGPLSVICCDNLPHNGMVVRGLVDEFAHARDPSLAQWIAQNASFPSTMVDRIVPATTDVDIADNDAALSAGENGFAIHDAAPVIYEPFRQWVIEDAFVTARPAWERSGAQFVGDVAPFELMKLRMLNGSHSTMAYLGYLAGYDFIYQVSADARFQRLVSGLWDESGATLPPLPGTDIGQYRGDLWTRYQNAALPHKTWQIAMDGSQKLPPRLLAPIRDRIKAGASIAHLALAVAGWMRYVAGTDERGQPIDVRDPLAAEFNARCTQNADPDVRARALLAIPAIFGNDLPADRHFVDSVTGWHRKLATQGVQHVLDSHFSG